MSASIMLKNKTLMAALLLCPATLLQAAPILNVGDSLQASIFTGTDGASASNPNSDGQGWYRYNLSTKFNYYTTDTAGTAPPKWGNQRDAGEYPSYLYFTYVQETSTANQLKLYGAHLDIGVAWVYTAAVGGEYELSFSALTKSGAGNNGIWEVIYTTDGSTWTTLSGGEQAGAATDQAFSVVLDAGDSIAFRWKNNRATYTGSTYTITDLQVALIPEVSSLALLGLASLLVTTRRNRMG